MAGDETHEEGGHGEASADAVVWFLCVSLTLGALVGALDKALPHTWWRPPYTVFLFFIGFVMDGMREALGPLGREMVNAAENVHPHVILFVLLPPLIYQSASTLDWHIFKKTAPQALLLAFPGVAMAAFATAGLAQACFTDYGWDFETALLLGSIVSATDPVAVVAALHELGAPKRLSSVIEGESLLNDGSAFVLFLIVQKHFAGEALTAGSVTEFFFRQALGGPAFGLLIGAVLGLMLAFMRFPPVMEVSLAVTAVFGTFFIADRELELSAVLAIVTLGLFMSARGQYLYTPGVEKAASEFLDVLAHWSNTAIFVLAGVVSYDSGVRNTQSAATWGYAVLLYVLLHVVRAGVVAIHLPLLRRLGYGMSVRDATLVTFGGLRGAVALALVLLLRLEAGSLSVVDQQRIEFLVAFVVISTLLINGTLVGALYRALHIVKPNPYHEVAFARAMLELEGETKSDICHALQRDWLFGGADWMCIDHMIPDLRRCIVVNGHVHVPRALYKTRVYATFLDHFRAEDSGRKHSTPVTPQGGAGAVPGGDEHDETAPVLSEAERRRVAFARTGSVLASMRDIKHGAHGAHDGLRVVTEGHVAAAREVPEPSKTVAPPELSPRRAVDGGAGVGAAPRAEKEVDGGGGDDDDDEKAEAEAAAAAVLDADPSAVEIDVLNAPAPHRVGSVDERADGSDGDDDDDKAKGGRSTDASPPTGTTTTTATTPEAGSDQDEEAADAAPRPPAHLVRRLSRQDSIDKLPPGATHTIHDLHRVLSRDTTFVRTIDSRVSSEDRGQEMATTLTSMLRADFVAQFDRGQVSDDAILAMNEAVDDALDCWRDNRSHKKATARSRRGVMRLMDHIWERLLEKVEPTPLPLLNVRNPVQVWVRFVEVVTKVEALSAYSRALIAVADLAAGMFPQDSIRGALIKHVDDAKDEFLAVQQAHPRWCMISRTLLTARAYMHLKRSRLHELAEEGVLEHSELESLEGLLERHMVALDSARLSWFMSRLQNRQA